MNERSKPPEVTANKEEVPKRHHDMWNILATVAVVFAALIAAPPVYWSYLCRSSGTWCEGSYLAPKADSEARDQVAKRISSDAEGKSFLGLQVREAGFWPINDRLDVVARFADGTETSIDTLPRGTKTEIYNDPSRAFVGVVTSLPNQKATRLTAYFPKLHLAKRIFDFTAGSTKYAVALSNISYVESKRRIVFDMTSGFPWITVNDNQALNFNISHRPSQEQISGATVALDLSDTLHAASVHTIENEREFARSENAFEACRTDISSKPKSDGDVFVCRRTQVADLRTNSGSVAIFEWRDGQLREVDTNNCGNGAYWNKDPVFQAIYVTCDHGGPGRASRWLSVYQYPFKEITYFLEGNCRDISLFDIRSDVGSKLVFHLWTDCSEIMVDQKPFRVVLPEKGELRATYFLALDREGSPISFAPQ